MRTHLTRPASRWAGRRRLTGAALALVPILASALVAQNQPRNGGATSGASAARARSPQQAALDLETYGMPPAEVARLVDAPRHRNVLLGNPSPDRTRLLALRGDGLPPVAAFGKPSYNLAGVQIDRAATRARSLTLRNAASIDVTDWRTGRTVSIAAPEGARVSDASWVPGGTEVAFLAHFDDATHLYVADAASGRARRVTRTPLLATLVTDVSWTADGRTVAAVLRPAGFGAEPAEPAVAPGPNVRLHQEGREKNRTYPSLLETPHDMALLEHYTTGQLALIDVASGEARSVGSPAMFRSVEIAPDGALLRVTTVRKPFSYTVPASNFASVEALWDPAGRVVSEIATRPLREGQVDGPDSSAAAAADTARRNLTWAPDGRGLVFLQMAPRAAGAARDTTTDSTAGRGARSTPRRDRLVHWSAPYDAGSARVLYESDARMGAVAFSDDGRMVFVNETQNGLAHTYAVHLDQPGTRHTIARGRGAGALRSSGGGGGGGGGGNTPSTPAARAQADSAFYGNPGTLVMRRGRANTDVVVVSEGGHVFLDGTRYAPDPMREAPRPFVDRVEIRTGAKTRVFESAADVFEQFAAPLDDDLRTMLVTRESPTMVPDSYVREASGTMRKLTGNVDVTPEITRAQRRQVQVTRADGRTFWVEVTLPASWKPGTRLPAMFWFYPREYTDQYGYDVTRRTQNPNRFPSTSPRSMDFLVTQGYAVVEPDSPIFGDPGRMNDNYVHDLRNNLAAVIDELDREGYIDRSRLGIGGHSYGAFSTVNAMVHTPFFKAGIAGDGNYNRTLTPNGFQSERRDLWEGRETYMAMSPFYFANNLTGALLMYHGLEDQNVGTHPDNSPRLFHALQGLGKTTALYMYPYEDHGPASRETLLDLWSRWVAWLDLYVKNPPPTGKPVM